MTYAPAAAERSTSAVTAQLRPHLKCQATVCEKCSLAWKFVTNFPFHHDLEGSAYRCSAMAEGFQIPDFKNDSQFRDQVSIVDPPGANSYPICSFTWLLVYQQQLDKTKGEQIVKFLTWALHDGQQYPAAREYAPIPSAIVGLEDKQIREIQLPK